MFRIVTRKTVYHITVADIRMAKVSYYKNLFCSTFSGISCGENIFKNYQIVCLFLQPGGQTLCIASLSFYFAVNYLKYNRI